MSDPDHLRLIYNGRDLVGDEKLEHYGIQQLDVIQAIKKMCGGGYAEGMIIIIFLYNNALYNINFISLSGKLILII